jgi:hypothetical protein
MAETTTAHPDQRQLRNVKTLVGLAVVSALVAAGSGLALLILAPESGSTAEATLSIAAAIAGISVAGFAIAAAVYAQITNLWQYAPVWVRVLGWVLIAYAVITTVRNWIT